MSNYRIIKVKGYDSLFTAQKRFLFFFWENYGLYEGSANKAQEWIDIALKRKADLRANPKNIVVKTIKG